MYIYIYILYKYKENIENISEGPKQILSAFTGRKKLKTWKKTTEKCLPGERIQYLTKIDRGSYNNQEECLEEFLGDEGTISNVSESDHSDNDDENYNKYNE